MSVLGHCDPVSLSTGGPSCTPRRMQYRPNRTVHGKGVKSEPYTPLSKRGIGSDGPLCPCPGPPPRSQDPADLWPCSTRVPAPPRRLLRRSSAAPAHTGLESQCLSFSSFSSGASLCWLPLPGPSWLSEPTPRPLLGPPLSLCTCTRVYVRVGQSPHVSRALLSPRWPLSRTSGLYPSPSCPRPLSLAPSPPPPPLYLPWVLLGPHDLFTETEDRLSSLPLLSLPAPSLPFMENQVT